MDFQTTNRIDLTEDQFENSPRWEAHLKSGLIIYSDGLYTNDKSDWERLADCCRFHDDTIEQFCIAFRDHKIYLNKTDHYYFRRCHMASFGGDSKEYFIVGGGQPGTIQVYKYSLPELMLLETEERVVTKEDLI